MLSPSSLSASPVCFPEAGDMVLRQEVGTGSHDKQCDFKLEVICMNRLFEPDQNGGRKELDIHLVREERDQQAEGTKPSEGLGKSARRDSSILTSSKGLAKDIHTEAVRLINYSLNSNSEGDTIVAPPLPIGIPLSQPPQLATMSHAMTSTWASSYGKRKHSDDDSSSSDTIQCDSKIYDANRSSDLAISGLSFGRKEMSPDERLFLEVASAWSTNTAPRSTKKSCSAARRKPGKTSSVVGNKKPLGPPPFLLPSGVQGIPL
jgi:hypothetical protein